MPTTPPIQLAMHWYNVLTDFLPAIAAIAAAIASYYAARFAKRMWQLEKKRDELKVYLRPRLAKVNGLTIVYAAEDRLRTSCEGFTHVAFRVINKNNFPIHIDNFIVKHDEGNTFLSPDAFVTQGHSIANDSAWTIDPFDAGVFLLGMPMFEKTVFPHGENTPCAILSTGDQIEGTNPVLEDYIDSILWEDVEE